MVVLAAGASTRFDGNKQLAPVGPQGAALLDYAIFDAHRSGVRRFVLVIRESTLDDFRSHIETIWGDSIMVKFAFQRRPPPPRQRPWGTGHATLAVTPLMSEPFCVINADDWYPPEGFVRLARSLASHAPKHALVTYRLDTTPMSGAGGVSRAVCEVGGDGTLLSIFEVTNIRKSSEGFVGNTMDGGVVALSGSEPVSMNFWGFDASVFEPLAEQFTQFRMKHVNDDAEFRLSTAINQLIQDGQCAVQVIDGGKAGFGMTYLEDQTDVSRRIQSLLDAGHYPERLADGLP